MVLIPDVCLDFLIGGLCLSSRGVQLIQVQVDLYGVIRLLLGQKNYRLYTLSPYEMVYMNERYYLICVPDHDPHTRLYRIDRMKDIQLLDESRSEAVARQEAQNAVYAYVGAQERIVMNCDLTILDDVIDRFGTEVQIRERDENTFTAGFTAPPRGVKFWALQYLPHVEVVEPKWQRGEIIESLGKNKYLALIKVV